MWQHCLSDSISAVLETANHCLRTAMETSFTNAGSLINHQAIKLIRQLKHIAEYAALSDSQFLELGHDAGDLGLFCSFHGDPCDEGDFYYFRDNRYGNCVTLNSGRKPADYNETSKYPGGLRTSSVAGPANGTYEFDNQRRSTATINVWTCPHSASKPRHFPCFKGCMVFDTLYLRVRTCSVKL